MISILLDMQFEAVIHSNVWRSLLHACSLMQGRRLLVVRTACMLLMIL